MEPISYMRMAAYWAAEAVKAYEAGEEGHVIRCYALMFGAIANSTGYANRLFKAGLDRGEIHHRGSASG